MQPPCALGSNFSLSKNFSYQFFFLIVIHNYFLLFGAEIEGKKVK